MPVHEKKFLPLLAVAKFGQPTNDEPIRFRLDQLKSEMERLYQEVCIGVNECNQGQAISEIHRWFEERQIPEKYRNGGFALELLGCHILKHEKQNAADKIAYDQCARGIKQALRHNIPAGDQIFERIPLDALTPHDGSNPRNALRAFEKSSQIFGKGNRAIYSSIDKWVKDGGLNFPPSRNNSNIIPFLKGYIHRQQPKTLWHRKLEFWLKWYDFRTNLAETITPRVARDTGKKVTFDGQSNVKIITEAKNQPDMLNHLSEALEGLYVLYKMRFGIPSIQGAEVSQELVLFHSLPTKIGSPNRAPHYTNWYIRRDGDVAEFHGTCFPGRVVQHVVATDDNFDGRMRFLNINQEDDLADEKDRFQNEMHRKVRGGVMLSETQEVKSEWSSASKFVLIRFAAKEFNPGDIYADNVSTLRKLGKKVCKFITPDAIPHPSKKAIFELIQNIPSERFDPDSGGTYPYLGNSLVMDQLAINHLARKTPKSWTPFANQR